MKKKFNILGNIKKTNILASIYDGILITDHKGRVVFANPAMEELGGRVRDKMVGKKAAEILAFVSKNKTPKRFLKEALEGWRGIKVDGRWKLLRRHCSPIPIRVVASPIFGNGVDLAGLMIVVKNVNEESCLPKRRKNSRSRKKSRRSR